MTTPVLICDDSGFARRQMARSVPDAWDVEINLTSFGWFEVCGVHDRTDYDLTQHAKFSKQKLEARNEATGKKEIPHVLEIAFGTDRLITATGREQGSH